MFTPHAHRLARILGLAFSSALLGGAVAKADIVSDIQNAKSGTTITVSGTYSVTTRINVPSGVTVKGPATFNFNGASAGFVPGNNTRLDQLTVKNVNGVGIYIYGTSGSVINSCIATGNKNTGIQIQGAGAKNNSIQYCQSYSNVDTATSGQNADGFAAKFSTGTGNVFKNCLGHHNSDDGWDFWQAGAPVTVTSCQAYNNGSLSAGNGNGFKMGSSGMNLAHVMTSCKAYSNSGTTGCGFTQNGNTGATKIISCSSYSNKTKDLLTNCVLSGGSTMQY
jgi:parallel beta-helix repeat protein